MRTMPLLGLDASTVPNLLPRNLSSRSAAPPPLQARPHLAAPSPVGITHAKKPGAISPPSQTSTIWGSSSTPPTSTLTPARAPLGRGRSPDPLRRPADAPSASTTRQLRASQPLPFTPTTPTSVRSNSSTRLPVSISAPSPLAESARHRSKAVLSTAKALVLLQRNSTHSPPGE